MSHRMKVRSLCVRGFFYALFKWLCLHLGPTSKSYLDFDWSTFEANPCKSVLIG